MFCYSNADLRKGEESERIFHFISFWERAHGIKPQHLVFDSKLITLLRRTKPLLQQVAALPRSAWRVVELDVPNRKYKTPRIYDQTVTVGWRDFRQLFIQDLGHDEST